MRTGDPNALTMMRYTGLAWRTGRASLPSVYAITAGPVTAGARHVASI
jgi:hypothetical protein